LSLDIVKFFIWAENLSRTEKESTNRAHPLPKHMEGQACDEREMSAEQSCTVFPQNKTTISGSFGTTLRLGAVPLHLSSPHPHSGPSPAPTSHLLLVMPEACITPQISLRSLEYRYKKINQLICLLCHEKKDPATF